MQPWQVCCQHKIFQVWGASAQATDSVVAARTARQGPSTISLAVISAHSALLGQHRDWYSARLSSRSHDGCQPGQRNCDNCQLGFFTSLQGQLGCISCTVGRYTNTTKATACLECQQGEFQVRALNHQFLDVTGLTEPRWSGWMPAVPTRPVFGRQVTRRSETQSQSCAGLKPAVQHVQQERISWPAARRSASTVQRSEHSCAPRWLTCSSGLSHRRSWTPAMQELYCWQLRSQRWRESVLGEIRPGHTDTNTHAVFFCRTVKSAGLLRTTLQHRACPAALVDTCHTYQA